MCMFNVGAMMALANAVHMSQENVRRVGEMAGKHYDSDSYVDHDTYDEEDEDGEEYEDEDYEEDGDPGDLDSFAEEMYENEYFAGDVDAPTPIDEWYE